MCNKHMSASNSTISATSTQQYEFGYFAALSEECLSLNRLIKSLHHRIGTNFLPPFPSFNLQSFQTLTSRQCHICHTEAETPIQIQYTSFQCHPLTFMNRQSPSRHQRDLNPRYLLFPTQLNSPGIWRYDDLFQRPLASMIPLLFPSLFQREL